MALLHVDEVEPGVGRHLRGGDERADQLVELVVGQHVGVGGPDPLVEQRMAIGDARRRLRRAVATSAPSA